MKVAVIGGGAAGFFAAITVKENYPDAAVVIFEKSKQLLSKVKVSGGGRCNVTNGSDCPSAWRDAYPRGGKQLQRAFRVFNNADAMRWFQARGVPLLIQDDGCVFPVSQNSQTIIDCFLSQAGKLGVEIEMAVAIKTIRPLAGGDQLRLDFADKERPSQCFDKVIVASGGCPQRKGLEWLEKLNHPIAEPLPSLFTFNLPGEAVTRLMGVVVENASVGLQGSRFKAHGPVLITHWGMSGPAILKLSAYAARYLGEQGYAARLQVNWVGVQNNDVVLAQLLDIHQQHAKKRLTTIRPYQLPERLWLYLLQKSGLDAEKKWGELGKKGLSRLVAQLTNDGYAIQGRTTFRDEFVTCGGVALSGIDFKTMQSKSCRNLYFAGEVLDIDGITGGYNFQAAWTTAFIAGKLS